MQVLTYLILLNLKQLIKLLENMYNKVMKTNIPKKGLFLFLSVFIFIGLYFLLSGIFPIEIEIKHNNTATAQIHRKSMIPPFKTLNISIPNVKQAVIGSMRGSKGGTTYRVEFESYNGYRVPLTAYYSSGYSSKEKLKNKINEAMRNGTDFKYVTRQTFMMFFGLIFITIPSIMMFLFIKAGDKQTNGLKTEQSRHTDNISEEDKYKKINDSIIK